MKCAPYFSRKIQTRKKQGNRVWLKINFQNVISWNRPSIFASTTRKKVWDNQNHMIQHDVDFFSFGMLCSDLLSLSSSSFFRTASQKNQKGHNDEVWMTMRLREVKDEEKVWKRAILEQSYKIKEDLCVLPFRRKVEGKYLEHQYILYRRNCQTPL